MNNKFTYLLTLLALLFISAGASAQTTGDYQSAATGNWSAAGSWQQWNGSAWVAAAHYPSISQDPAGFKITILNGPTITYDGNGANLSADTVNRIEVMNGGILAVNNGGDRKAHV